MIRQLIVNADDFGMTPGVSRGIVRAHTDGVVTATSLMVLAPAAELAAQLAAEAPELDVGLHAERPTDGDWPTALARQLARFTELTGRRPTHLDSHHHVHTTPAALPHFQRVAGELGIPLRGFSPAVSLTQFFGRWADTSHPEVLSTDRLLRLLDEQPDAEWAELMCHPGLVDADLRSSYTTEREIELRTLCEAELRAGLTGRGIALARFRDLPRT